MKQNCWEYYNCGREPGGRNAESGVCPAAVQDKVDGLHGGVNGGRVCWAIKGTYCGEKMRGSFALKMQNCMQCGFFKSVCIEEEKSKTLLGIKSILDRLK